MDDMADYALDRLFDDLVCNEDAVVACNRCGECPLYWDEIDDDVWRLCDEAGNLHHCAPDAEGFEAL